MKREVPKLASGLIRPDAFFPTEVRLGGIAIRSRCAMADSRLDSGEQLQSLWSLGGLTWRELGRRVWGGINQTDLINRSYELAYNFLFAVFPLLFFFFALLGFFAKEGGTLRTSFYTYVQFVLPPEAFQILTNTIREITRNGAAGKLTFGLVFALYSGSAGMTQLMSTLNAAYEVREERSWIRIHLISLGLTLAMSVLVIAALFLVLAGGHVIATLGSRVGLSAAAFVTAKVLQWTLALGFIVIAFAVVYYFAPDVEEQHWYWITPGSVIGVALWAAVSAALRVYLHFFNSYTKSYGSLGAVMILMLWFYVAGLAVLVGGQINATIEHAAAEHGHIEAKEPGAKAA
jgi:membrane protein